MGEWVREQTVPGPRRRHIKVNSSATRLAGVLAAGVIALTFASVAGARNANLWQNCTHVHAKYRHGVGRANAHDHTTGTPVTNFYRNTRLYKAAISYNSRLDADKDGIACEKR
jgi:Excalibur calcium-binding domain